MASRIVKGALFSLALGIITGGFFAVMAGFFIPDIFTDWAGSFVCEGKMVFNSLQGKYFCYTSPTVSHDLGNTVFRTMFKMFLIPCIAVCVLLWYGFYRLLEFLTAERTEN